MPTAPHPIVSQRQLSPKSHRIEWTARATRLANQVAEVAFRITGLGNADSLGMRDLVADTGPAVPAVPTVGYSGLRREPVGHGRRFVRGGVGGCQNTNVKVMILATLVLVGQRFPFICSPRPVWLFIPAAGLQRAVWIPLTETNTGTRAMQSELATRRLPHSCTTRQSPSPGPRIWYAGVPMKCIHLAIKDLSTPPSRSIAAQTPLPMDVPLRSDNSLGAQQKTSTETS